MSDGIITYAYDHTNRLISIDDPTLTASFAYNGLGDRRQQTVNGQTTNYTLDLAAGLTQVLADGTTGWAVNIPEWYAPADRR